MTEDNSIQNAVEQGGSYDVIRKRLDDISKTLASKTESLNNARIEQFGNLKQQLLSKFNIHTENASIPVDMTQINGYIFFGHNVFLGMKSKVSLDDVFGLYKIEEKDSTYNAVHVPLKGTFIDHPEFNKSFDALVSFYKDTQLLQILNDGEGVSIIFQIGKSIKDLKVFRWIKERNGEYSYIGETSVAEVLSKFENHFKKWTRTGRSNFVEGKHPHISIKDKVFVETINGDLTIKVENNTDVGQGIYSESVDNELQNLEDAEISYVEAGDTILLQIKPYQEKNYRYFIFNVLTQKVIRCDGIGTSCVELPEDHGFIFSNGYYLKSGEHKIFDVKNKFFFQKSIKSPNGEDFLYVFFDPNEKEYVLYPYNLVTKTIETPIFTNGYSLYDSGRLYVMKSSTEATRVHPLQLWQTSFLSDTEYAKQEKGNEVTFYTKIGNTDLVRCVSDIYTVKNLIEKKEVSTTLYEGIIKLATKISDEYHWLNSEKAFDIKSTIQNIIDTSVLIINEFEKVVSIKKQAKEAIEKASASQKLLISSSKALNDRDVSKYIEMLGNLKQQLGVLITLKGQRYIDLTELSQLEKQVIEAKSHVNEKLIVLLQEDNAFAAYVKEASDINVGIKEIKKVIDLKPFEERLDKVVSQINIVNDEINDIDFKDPTVVSVILDKISNIFATLNQIKATIKNIKKTLMSGEAKLEFAAQFKLLSQSVSSAITGADTPEKCDEQMTRILNQIESLESKFTDFDEFLEDIYKKREEVKDIFENYKQQLVNERQKRVLSIENASKITLNSIQKRIEKISSTDEMNSFFASDSLVLKYQSLVKNIQELGDNIKADELFAAFKNAKDQSLRQLRDSQDIFEDNGNIIKMGKHRFSVNKSPFDLSIINKDGKMFIHLTSTNFYQEIDNADLNNLKTYWNHDVVSESASIYRAEYLAYCILKDAENNNKDISMKIIEDSIKEKTLLNVVSNYASSLYKEGYIKGVHDNDAALILESLFNVYQSAETLKFAKNGRLIAAVYVKNNSIDNALIEKYKKAKNIKKSIGNDKLFENVIEELKKNIKNQVSGSEEELSIAAEYIFESEINSYQYPELSKKLYDNFASKHQELLIEVNSVQDGEDFISIFKSFGDFNNEVDYSLMADEVVLYSILKEKANRKLNALKVNTLFDVKGLFGQHALVSESEIKIELDDLFKRADYHKNVVQPSYELVDKIKHDILTKENAKLRISDFKAKPLSSFVRNKLITESYFPLIGDNLAKQMGTVGENKRTDLMGMLLLISPPGYGKTTIIEYVAQKLGLVFMKINCPSLGHNVTSLDPNDAPDATSKKEVEKINLACEMGNNVLLYLDDIQHTNPEFLQKFISLCDGSRRIDGVWNGVPKTYDLKGKKFAIVMAGNPYTESGEVFKIPDMLSNRADIYNLGDMLSGQEEVFKLSYIENSLTSNQVLAPLATRDLNDLYKFIEMAQGENHPLNEFSYNYSPAEANEVVDVIKKMMVIQSVVSKVNQQYIISAATADKYRTEPAFKLQGSYRNMNKMSEKVVSVMNDEEINTMILDHYVGEAQTLTTGTEENLLKLKELLGIQSETESTRWNEIKTEFVRSKTLGDSDTDGFTKIANQLSMFISMYEKENGKNVNDSLMQKILEVNENISKLAPNEEKDAAITDLFRTLDTYLLSKVKKK